VGGDFTQTTGSSRNFGAGGTHKVVLNGSGTQTVSFDERGIDMSNRSRFQNLEIANSGGGVNLATSTAVWGDLTITSGTLRLTPTTFDDGTDSLEVRGNATNNGTFELTSANDTTGQELMLNVLGTLTNNGIINALTGVSAGTRVVNGTITNTGTMAAVDHPLTITGSSFDHQDGAVLQGASTVDITATSDTLSGDFSPGTGAGVTAILTIADSLTLDAQSAVNVELAASTTAGTDYDQLAVNTTATILSGATLNVTLLGGYTPSVGETFTVLTCGTSCAGNLAAGTLPGGVNWQITNVGGTAIVLEVIP